jgi:hypothetical protein
MMDKVHISTGSGFQYLFVSKHFMYELEYFRLISFAQQTILYSSVSKHKEKQECADISMPKMLTNTLISVMTLNLVPSIITDLSQFILL